MSDGAPVILVTGFEPFGAHAVNPSELLAKAVDGLAIGQAVARGATLPVHHLRARAMMTSLLTAWEPVAVLHLGLAASRARLALERVAINVLDYPLPDADGWQACDEPCVPDGPAARFATLPLRSILEALAADGIPAHLSNSAGTYLCNQTLYWTLHRVEADARRPRVGFMHVPLLPAMVAATGVDAPSMDLGLMQRAVELTLRVIARSVPSP